MLHQLPENMADHLDRCAKIYKRSELLFYQKSSNQSLFNDSAEDDVDPTDRISLITTNASGTSNTSSVFKRIELEHKKAELQSLEELNKLKARKAKLETEEASMKLRLETANPEAEKKCLLALSEALKSEAYQNHLHVHVGLAKVVLKFKKTAVNLSPKSKTVNSRLTLLTLYTSECTAESSRYCKSCILQKTDVKIF